MQQTSLQNKAKFAYHMQQNLYKTRQITCISVVLNNYSKKHKTTSILRICTAWAVACMLFTAMATLQMIYKHHTMFNHGSECKPSYDRLHALVYMIMHCLFLLYLSYSCDSKHSSQRTKLKQCMQNKQTNYKSKASALLPLHAQSLSLL